MALPDHRLLQWKVRIVLHHTVVTVVTVPFVLTINIYALRPMLFYFGSHDAGFARSDSSDLSFFSVTKMPLKKRPLLKTAYEEASKWKM